MAPAIHPPCTPQSSCSPMRCHPTPPPCKNPEKCLRKTQSKGVRPCQSAASIMRTRSKSSGGSCSNCPSCSSTKSNKAVKKFLKRKSKEAKLRKKDRLKGTNKYLKYQRKKGKPRASKVCCEGKGHRGRMKRKKCCTIL